jgi:Na+-transporting methylmalonyl-CoA/oxaloacetate decarboxylase gamma subunit
VVSEHKGFLGIGFVFLFLKIYLFYLYEYIVAILRHTRRGHPIPVQMVVSHHVAAGN